MRISDWSSDVCSSDLKRGDSAWMRWPSATTRRKARRASQPNAGARHHCLRAWMPELVPARIRREAQGTGEAGAEPACARRKAFWVLFRREKGLAGRRPVNASASIERKRVVWGKSVSGRVDLGGRRISKKKKKY